MRVTGLAAGRKLGGRTASFSIPRSFFIFLQICIPHHIHAYLQGLVRVGRGVQVHGVLGWGVWRGKGLLIDCAVGFHVCFIV